MVCYSVSRKHVKHYKHDTTRKENIQTEFETDFEPIFHVQTEISRFKLAKVVSCSNLRP